MGRAEIRASSRDAPRGQEHSGDRHRDANAEGDYRQGAHRGVSKGGAEGVPRFSARRVTRAPWLITEPFRDVRCRCTAVKSERHCGRGCRVPRGASGLGSAPPCSRHSRSLRRSSASRRASTARASRTLRPSWANRSTLAGDAKTTAKGTFARWRNQSSKPAPTTAASSCSMVAPSALRFTSARIERLSGAPSSSFRHEASTGSSSVGEDDSRRRSPSVPSSRRFSKALLCGSRTGTTFDASLLPFGSSLVDENASPSRCLSSGALGGGLEGGSRSDLKPIPEDASEFGCVDASHLSALAGVTRPSLQGASGGSSRSPSNDSRSFA